MRENKKGDFALTNVSTIILILIGLILLIFFVYFLRGRLKDYIEVLLDFLGI